MRVGVQALSTGDVEDVDVVLQKQITVEDAKKAREVFLTSSTALVMPVVQWDNQPIGDGHPGMVTMALRALMEQVSFPS